MHADGEVVHDPQRHSRRRPPATARRRVARRVAIAASDGNPLPLDARRRTSATPSAPGCCTDSGHCASRCRTSRPAHTRSRSRRAQHPRESRYAAYARSRPDRAWNGDTPVPALPAWPPTRVSRSIESSAAACFWTPSRSRRTRPRLRRSRELRNGLDSQIQRVDEAARRRQIRRRLHRRGRLRRVQRIDQDVTGAVNRRRPHRKVNEIGEVADTPGLAGPDAV